MKKILAVSLVVVMAVSTARADIASTAYVQGAVGAEKALRESADNAIKDSIGTVNKANMGTTTATTVVTAIKEHSDAIAGKVTANTAITGATKAKITYDLKGLVTGGADLTASDIPTLAISKISGLQDALDAKQATLTIDSALSSTSTNPVQNKVVNTALAGKVTANTAITGATKAKITYDSKGLVTGGADLAASDIPTLAISKISGLQTALDAKEASANKVNTTTEAEGKDKGVIFPTYSLVETLIDSNTADMADQVAANKSDIATINNSDVMKSGVKAATVSQVATNKSDIATINNSDVMKSGVKAATVTQVATNKSDIATINNSAVMKSGITSTKVGTYDAYDARITTAQNTADAALPAAQGSANKDKAVITDATGNIITGTIATGMIANGAVTAAKIGANVAASGNTLTNPTTDGNYVLTLKVVNGALSMGWEAIDRTY